MTILEVPLSPAPQTFFITLNGVDYKLVVVWNTPATCWMMDIQDGDGNLIIGSIPLITGVDLLGPYAYLGIGGSLFVLTDAQPNEVPTFSNLGVNSHLYFVT